LYIWQQEDLWEFVPVSAKSLSSCCMLSDEMAARSWRANAGVVWKATSCAYKMRCSWIQFGRLAASDAFWRFRRAVSTWHVLHAFINTAMGCRVCCNMCCSVCCGEHCSVCCSVHCNVLYTILDADTGVNMYTHAYSYKPSCTHEHIQFTELWIRRDPHLETSIQLDGTQGPIIYTRTCRVIFARTSESAARFSCLRRRHTCRCSFALFTLTRRSVCSTSPWILYRASHKGSNTLSRCASRATSSADRSPCTCIFIYIYIRVCVYMCMCVCVHVCVCIYILVCVCLYILSFVRVYTYPWVCVCVYILSCVRVYTHPWVCMCVYIFSCVYVYISLCVCVYRLSSAFLSTCMHVYVYVNTYVYVYTQTHTYIHVCVYMFARVRLSCTRIHAYVHTRVRVRVG